MAREPQDFSAMMREAEEASGVPSDAETYGQFLPQDEAPAVAEPDPEPAAEPEPTPEPDPEPEAVAPPVQAEPDAELKRQLGTLLNENAELRREFQALQDRVNQPPAQPVQLPSQDAFDEWANSNPVAAAEWARTNNQPFLYERAVRAWGEVDPFGASRYENAIRQQQMEERLAQQIRPQIETAEAYAQRQSLETALTEVARNHPDDFAQVMANFDITNPGIPTDLLAPALAGDDKSRQTAFEMIYRWRKAEQSAALAGAAPSVAQRQTEEAKQTKVEATVASTNTTATQIQPSTNPDDYTVGTPEWEAAEAARLVETWGARPSLRTAWKGQESRGGRGANQV